MFPILSLSTFSPWKSYNVGRVDWQFNKWFNVYGEPYKRRINGFDVPQYDRMHVDDVFSDIERYIVPITRKEGGHTHEAVDKLHHITLTKKQDNFINKLKKDLFVEKNGELFLADTPATMGQKLHQISGGFVRGDENALHVFKRNPKIEYINANFDPAETVILAFYKAEQEHLAKLYPNVGSTTKQSEGVDYSHFRHMIIYSHGHSGATYEQVRSRQMNVNRKWPIEVHFLIAGEIDQRVYDIASGKAKYTSRWYE